MFPTLTLQKALLVLKGVLLGLLVVAGIALTMAFRGQFGGNEHLVMRYATIILAVVVPWQFAELAFVNPSRAQKWFGAYKMVSALTALLAFAVLFFPTGLVLWMVLGISAGACYLTAIFDLGEILYM